MCTKIGPIRVLNVHKEQQHTYPYTLENKQDKVLMVMYAVADHSNVIVNKFDLTLYDPYN